MRHFHEKLRDEHNIGLSYTCVQQALQEPGWWPRSARGERIGADGRAGRWRG